MGMMIRNGTDVVTFLHEQHQDIEAAMRLVVTTHGVDRAGAFVALRRLLAVHETAEEEIVHPAARRALANGELIVDAHLHEEKMAKEVLAELEKLDPDSTAFETRFEALQAAVLVHAQSEEKSEFQALAAVLDAKRLERMRKAAEIAESLAPTRPHPGLESATANVLVGPFAAMIDRTRDALARKG
jgi:hypothetical protein